MSVGGDPHKDTAAEPPAKEAFWKGRRNQLIAAGVVVVAGFAIKVALSEHNVQTSGPLSGLRAELASNASAGARSAPVPHMVKAHSRMQAYGPNRSLRRPIEVPPYPRGAPRAA